MADTKTSALTSYTSNNADDLVPIVDTTNSTLKQTTVQNLMRNKVNYSTSSVSSAYASDTYLAGSFITFPTGTPDVATLYRCKFDITKTAVGTATPIVTVRIGTAGSVADTARHTFTFSAGTAAAETGIFEVEVYFRTVGSGTSAVTTAEVRLNSNPTTGLSSLIHGLSGVSSGFDSTVAGLGIGLSFNGGASFVGSNTFVKAELIP